MSCRDDARRDAPKDVLERMPGKVARKRCPNRSPNKKFGAHGFGLPPFWCPRFRFVTAIWHKRAEETARPAAASQQTCPSNHTRRPWRPPAARGGPSDPNPSFEPSSPPTLTTPPHPTPPHPTPRHAPPRPAPPLPLSLPLPYPALPALVKLSITWTFRRYTVVSALVAELAEQWQCHN